MRARLAQRPVLKTVTISKFLKNGDFFEIDTGRRCPASRLDLFHTEAKSKDLVLGRVPDTTLMYSVRAFECKLK